MTARYDYYRLLHVQQDAPTEVIKASYRTLMQKLRQHPDLGGDESKAALLNEAYTVLRNPELRARYDLRSERSGAGGERCEDVHRQSPSGAETLGGTTDRVVCVFCKTSNAYIDKDDSESECRTCSSPLQPVTRWALEHARKRAVERIQHSARMVFFDRWPQPTGIDAIVQDLSPNGMRFRSGQLVEVDTVIKIAMESLFATARIVKCTGQGLSDKYTVGVEFLTIRFRTKRGTFVSSTA